MSPLIWRNRSLGGAPNAGGSWVVIGQWRTSWGTRKQSSWVVEPWRYLQNSECYKRNDEKDATELLHDTFPQLHMVFQAGIVRSLLKLIFAKRVFGNVQRPIPYKAYAAISKPADANWMR